MADSVPGWMLDEKTLAEVEVTDKQREPVRDPRLEIDVEARRGAGGVEVVHDPVRSGKESC